MDRIETFVELSFEEQKKFAEALVKTINTENIFSGEVDFKLTGVEADEFGGGLIILIETEGSVSVSREASWTCSDEDEMEHDPEYTADYTSSLFDDAKKAFKATETIIEGYKVSLEVDSVEEVETTEVNVTGYSQEDSGIGSYSYWGSRYYDSRPYIQVEGVINVDCDCELSLYVEPAK